MNKEFDAVVIGSGPNGLSAAILLQQQGLRVIVLESKSTIGGGCRSSELTLPGFVHDVCSAIHPLACSSPFFKKLPLDAHGLKFIFPEIDCAHPFEDGSAAVLNGSVKDTALQLGEDEGTYIELVSDLVARWERLAPELLGPIGFPKNPLGMVRFGLKAMRPASALAEKFTTREGKGLWAGMAAHAMQPLTNWSTSAIGMVLLAAGHVKGWPAPAGGAGQLTKALASYFLSLSGTIETDSKVSSMNDIPPARIVLFDLTPKQIMEIAGDHFSSIYRWQLNRFRYGMGVFKIDWALDEQVPFLSDEARKAGTLHLGNTFEEIRESEKLIAAGKHPEKPFVLMAQQSVFDPTRAPSGKHTAWAYCHVPNGSVEDMTPYIENQVERFAPGFKDLILARHTMNTRDMQAYNANYIGGDINGGVIDLAQLFTRPALRPSPYRTSAKGIYICSSSTPPGGGVHGMCGYNAAKQALKDVFNINI